MADVPRSYWPAFCGAALAVVLAGCAVTAPSPTPSQPPEPTVTSTPTAEPEPSPAATTPAEETPQIVWPAEGVLLDGEQMLWPTRTKIRNQSGPDGTQILTHYGFLDSAGNRYADQYYGFAYCTDADAHPTRVAVATADTIQIRAMDGSMTSQYAAVTKEYLLCMGDRYVLSFGYGEGSIDYGVSVYDLQTDELLALPASLDPSGDEFDAAPAELDEFSAWIKQNLGQELPVDFDYSEQSYSTDDFPQPVGGGDGFAIDEAGRNAVNQWTGATFSLPECDLLEQVDAVLVCTQGKQQLSFSPSGKQVWGNMEPLYAWSYAWDDGSASGVVLLSGDYYWMETAHYQGLVDADGNWLSRESRFQLIGD